MRLPTLERIDCPDCGHRGWVLDVPYPTPYRRLRLLHPIRARRWEKYGWAIRCLMRQPGGLGFNAGRWAELLYNLSPAETPLMSMLRLSAQYQLARTMEMEDFVFDKGIVT